MFVSFNGSTTSVTSGAETSNPFGAPEFTPVFSGYPHTFPTPLVAPFMLLLNDTNIIWYEIVLDTSKYVFST